MIVKSHGSLIIETDYWQSERAKAGHIFVSSNGGAIRVLIPPKHRDMIEAARASEYAIVSVGPWPAAGATAFEILWEDHSDNPYVVHVAPEACGMLPGEPPPGEAWVISIWDEKKGRPHKAVERRCHWRRVAELPCLQPWEDRK